MPPSRPTVYTIPAGASFVEALAQGVLDEHGADPVALSRVRILLPNRRAVRTLREAFLRIGGGKPLILPSMQPLGDIDEGEITLMDRLGDGADMLDLPPAVPPLKRAMLLAPRVMTLRRARGDDNADDPASALLLAMELGRFLDQVQTEECDFADLKTLVPDSLASHWQVTLEFLDILGAHWPGVLEEAGYLDAADRRNRLLRRLSAIWSDTPPDFPVIVAGSTGSIPASAELIRTVAFLPTGSVVLPGLDPDADEESWAALGPSHPQFGMKQLLSRMAVDRAEVDVWPASPGAVHPARVRLLSEAMRPAATAANWETPKLDMDAALNGLHLIEAPNRQAEAGAVALVLREALETPGRTAALVTPDRELARRVASALGRWGIEIDDSAGRPLRETPPGVFMRLIVAALEEDFAPVPLLAVLKHPLCAAGQDPAAFRAKVRALELAVLRGPRPAPGLDGVGAALEENEEGQTLLGWWDDVAVRWQRLVEIDADTAPEALLEAHSAVAEALAETDTEPGRERLWQGEAGEGLAVFLRDFADAVKGAAAIEPGRYGAFFDAAIFDSVVRPAYGAHPRLAILGPLEARLHHADVMILGGLNEEGWPPDPGADPWMNRGMRAQFGLPLPERRIGLSAHDFVQGATAPVVYLTRAEKVDGAPTLPSRWLLRMDAVLKDQVIPEASHVGWADAIDDVVYERPDEGGPQPRPPVDARPRKLSVTRVEALMRDPYGLYAQKILGLEPLADLDEEPGAKDRGTFIHDALDRFMKESPPDDEALDRLLALGRKAFGPMLDRPLVRAFWWPRFEQIAAWFLEQEAIRRSDILETWTEHRGELVLKDLPGGPFTLSATADRIDRLSDGYEIIDYKTGPEISGKQVLAGYASQMPLEAAILGQGGFPKIKPEKVKDLVWWHLRGAADKNKIRRLSKLDDIKAAIKAGDFETIDDLAAEALDGLCRVVSAFDDPKTPYLSRPDPTERGFGDYDHLARVKEWGA